MFNLCKIKIENYFNTKFIKIISILYKKKKYKINTYINGGISKKNFFNIKNNSLSNRLILKCLILTVKKKQKIIKNGIFVKFNIISCIYIDILLNNNIIKNIRAPINKYSPLFFSKKNFFF